MSAPKNAAGSLDEVSPRGSAGFVPLAGSERRPVPDSRLVGDVHGDDPVSVSVYIRPKTGIASIPSAFDLGEIPPQLRRYASPEQIDSYFAADPAELEQVGAYAKSAGLEVLEMSARMRTVRLKGNASAMKAAFNTDLKYYENETARYRGRIGPVKLPAELSKVVEAVFGLDNRLVGCPWPGIRRSAASRALTQVNAYLPPQVAQLYNYPAQYDGTGECIAIFVLNGQIASTGIVASGGYSASALSAYFGNVLRMQTPEIVDVLIHGLGNNPDPSNPFDVSGEVMLDIQVAGSCAPGAKLAVYFTEFTEQGWVDAILAAVHDTTNNPSVISISYGNPEDIGHATLWTESAIRKLNEAFQIAAFKGITITCASGDGGSGDFGTVSRDGLAHVDFPASSPYVLACGGTRLESANGTITMESAWNDGPGRATGGGVSTLFPVPAYQRFVGVPRSANPGHRAGRAVPDVSGLADPETGVWIFNVSGNPEERPLGGTSLTAPLWAALIARINQALGVHVGFFNPILYKYFSRGVLRDITIGENGLYSAGPGYDAVTGLGSADGGSLLAAFHALVAAPHLMPAAQPRPLIDPLEARLARIETFLDRLSCDRQ